MTNVPATTPVSLFLVSSASTKAKSTTSTNEMAPSPNLQVSTAEANHETQGESRGLIVAISASAKAFLSSQEIFLDDLVDEIKLAIAEGSFQLDSKKIAGKLISNSHDLLDTQKN